MLYVFIDDEPICNLISKAKLRIIDPKANAQTFNSGKEALIYFEENLHLLRNEKIVIFLDINMPEMNGFEFLHEFNNKLAPLLQVVVFMLSSSIAEVDKQVAFQFSLVKDFFSKPLQAAYIDQIDKYTCSLVNS